PRRMLLQAVDADDGALIAAENHAIGVVGRDPELVVIVAARRSLERLAERLAAVARTVDAGVRDVDEIGVLRIGDDLAEVPAASPDALIARRLRPRRAAVVGAEEAALLRVDDRVHAAGPRGGDRQPDAAASLDRNPRVDLLPVVAAVGRLEDPAAGTVGGRVHAPRRTPRVPERRVDRARVRRIDREIDRADVVALEEHFLPRRAAVLRTEDAAIRIRAVRVAERCDVDEVRVARVNEDARDVLRVVESDVPPRLAGIGRLVHSVAVRDLRPHVGLARADVHGVGLRRRDRHRADRRDRLAVEDRLPRAAGVDRLPDAAADRAEVEDVDLPRHAGDAVDAAAAERADEAPAKARVQALVDPARLRRELRP